MKKKSQIRLPYFDGFLIAKSDGAKELVESIARQVVKILNPSRPSSIKRVKRQVEAIVCNVTLNEETVIPLSKRVLGTKNRYRAPVLKESIRPTLDTLAYLRYITLDIGSNAEFEPVEDDEDGGGDTFIAEATAHIGLSRISSSILPRIPRGNRVGGFHFGRHPHEGERIILKKPKLRGHRGWNLQYEDSDDTRRMRCELETLSNAIRKSAEYLGEDIRIDDNEVFLQRHFTHIDGTKDFTNGGRIFGTPSPWWLRLSTMDRFRSVAIDGDDQLVELDYGQHGIRCLYALGAAKTRFHDAYAIPGYENHREGVKKVLNSMIWAEAPLTRFPKSEGSKAPLSTLFPRGTKVGDVTEAILRFHEPVAHLFYRGQGHKLFYLESEMMVKVLMLLLDAGIVALPYHDAILVSEKHQAVAVQAMLSSFADVTGLEGLVTVNRSYV